VIDLSSKHIMQISEAEKEYVQAEFIKEKRICFQEL
jgi:hypothetical protein